MSDLPSFSYKKFVKKIKKAGFIFKRQAAGSHEIWFCPTTKRTVTIPNHPGDLKKGTLSGMVKDTGLSRERIIPRTNPTLLKIYNYGSVTNNKNHSSLGTI